MEASFLDQILDKVSSLEGISAYITVFSVLFACGLGLPIPEDVTLVTTGYLAYLENINLFVGVGVCFLGVICGDLILFTFGRLFGRHFLELPGVRFVMPPARVAFAQAKLKKNARKVCFLARFLAGLRAPVYFSAGMFGIKTLTFVVLDGLAALISVPVWVYLGYYFGDEIDVGLHYVRRAEKYVLLTLAVIGLFFILNSFRKKMREA